MAGRAQDITLGELALHRLQSVFPRPLIAEGELLDRAGPVVELHHHGRPAAATIRTGAILGLQDQGPHLRFPAEPLLPPPLPVGMIVGTLVGALLLSSRRHGFSLLGTERVRR